MQEVKVSFYLKRNEEKADGTTPILGRIRIEKSMVQFSAKVCVPVSLWDTKSGRAIGKSKVALSINASLNKICVAIHSAYKDLLVKKENVSALEVKNAFQGIASEQDTLVKYYEAHNQSFLKNVGVNRCMATCKRYGVSLNHLKRFMRKKYNISDISFQALTPSFVIDYDYYLRVELRFVPQTIVNTISQLRRIIKIAINNGLVRNDPFMDYKYITAPIVPKSLTAEELKQLMKAKLSRPNLNFIRDMFLFSSFTGVAFSDMRNLTEKNLSTAEDGVKWIHFNRKKTGTPSHIPVLELPLQLIEKYRGLGKDGKLFPMISCSKTNIYLKRIAAECKINKPITFHQARHCYASVVTLSQGVPLETVGELLGHRDWRATRIYAQISNEKIGEDMRTLNKRLSGKFRFDEESKNPFATYIPEQPPRKRRHMTQEELDKFMSVSIDSKRVCHTRDMFIFATFTGLAYADMCNLSEDHIHKERNGSLWIKIKRQKTGSLCNIPLLDVPRQIIDKYKSERKGSKIFNMIAFSSVEVNLKKIAKLCGVEKCVTYHVARHSIYSFPL